MGHDVRVHREFYRLPESTMQIAKISKLLLSLEKGTTSKLAGKGLEEIEMTEDDGIFIILKKHVSRAQLRLWRSGLNMAIVEA